MAWTAALYVQPTAEDASTGAYQTIEFPGSVGLSVLEDRPVRDRRGAVPPCGLPRFANYGMRRTLTIEVAQLKWADATHRACIQKLASIDSALTLGAVCHFTRDTARIGAWALRNSADSAYAVPALAAATFYRDYSAGSPVNLFGATAPGGGSLTATDTTGAGDNMITIETQTPESHAHHASISAITPASISVDFAPAFLHTVSSTRAYARWSYFWPALTLADEALDAPRLVQEGVLWTWRASFVMSPQRVFDLFP